MSHLAFKHLEAFLGSTVSIFGYSIGSVADLVIGRRITIRPQAKGTFEERLGDITTKLTNSTSEAQMLLDELEATIKVRSEAVANAEVRVAELSRRESETQQHLAELEKASPEAARAFHDLMESTLTKGNRSANRRDLVIFILGVIASIIVQVIYGLIVGELKLPPL